MFDINFDALSSYYGRAIEDLKRESYSSLEALMDRMRKEKAEQEAKRNTGDKEYVRILQKYFTLWEFLTGYWTESEVILAASRHMSIRDLTEERPLRQGRNPAALGKDAEYLRTSMESLPRYSRVEHEQLFFGERAMCDVYRVRNRYQHLRHGKVVENLLYGTFPELREFKFSIYGYQYGPVDQYEIYPENHIYTPLKALLEGNIEAIKERNLSYGKSYNFGEYTVSAVKGRLEGEEGSHYFDVIRSLDREKLKNYTKD